MKKIKYLLLILCLFIIKPSNIHAEEDEGGFNTTWDETSNGKNNQNIGDKPTKIEVTGVDLGKDSTGKISYTCSYTYNVKASSSLQINVYDMNNKYLIKGNLTVNTKIPAGTSIGIYANESKTVSYTVYEEDIVVHEITQKVTEGKKKCNYICTTNQGKMISETINSSKSCSTDKKDSNSNLCYYHSEETISYSSTKTVSDISDNAGKKDECKGIAIPAAQRAANKLIGGSSYQIETTNSNDIDGVKHVIEAKEGSEQKFSGSALSDSKTINFPYKMEKVCLNAKTAKITYKSKTEECSADEILISDDTVSKKTHWHYFIPLNSKSTDEVMIQFSKGTEDVSTCNNIIDSIKSDKHSNKPLYLDLIVPLGNYRYVGNKQDDKDTTTAAGGCKKLSIIKIPVKQDFYYEEEIQNDVGTKQLTLQGNKFYFRRIDIQKPFNYKITDPNSLWYDWYNSNYDSENIYSMNKVKPYINKSFNKILYYTQNNNIRDIRKYNSIMKYYDWTEMKKNGESCLISDQNGGTNCDSNTAQGLSIAKRNFNSGDNGTPYKLGHGPESTICTEGDKEVAYIGAKECENAG